jgi:hypothetical protein
MPLNQFTVVLTLALIDAGSRSTCALLPKSRARACSLSCRFTVGFLDHFVVIQPTSGGSG